MQTYLNYRMEVSELSALLGSLKKEGYQIFGPKLKNQVIIYDEIESLEDLPKGWTDDQEKGQYRVRRRSDDAYFGYNVGPHSWKQFLFPAREKVWTADLTAESKGSKANKGTRGTSQKISFHNDSQKPKGKKMAFLGVRGCELAAISIQDRIFLKDQYKNESYEVRRTDALLIAVQCTQAGKTCFCVSMGTGPQVKSGYDLVLTEVLEEGAHFFVLTPGSEKGQKVAKDLKQAASTEVSMGERHVDRAARSMGRTLNTERIKERLYAHLDHPNWNEVSERCLSCTNCTAVCPTCFCSSVEDTIDLKGLTAERWRNWDSCFNLDHSYLHGGNVHASVKSRYRQWLTHKLASTVARSL